jgi:hypothetical protein
MVVLRLDLDVIVTLSNIQGGKECLPLELLKDMGNLWYGIDILDRPLVDFVIVLYQPQGAVVTIHRDFCHAHVHLALLFICDACTLYAMAQGAVMDWE